MRSTAIVAVALATILMLVPIYLVSSKLTKSIHVIQEAPSGIQKFRQALDKACGEVVTQEYCRLFLFPFNRLSEELATLGYLIRRSSISKTELPILHFYMTPSALDNLRKKRESALSERRPILITKGNDWVKASIIVDNGNNQRKTEVKIRLKGDLEDHFIDPRKWSVRINVRNKQLVMGMSKFSLQAPHTRNYQNAAMLASMMRSVGVLAPGYFFVDVRINDKIVGIMALEEHFTKEMVESQKRREGPIIAVDEDWSWQQRFLNYNRISMEELEASAEKLNVELDPFFQDQSNLATRDLPVRVFQSGLYVPGTIRNQNVVRGTSLLRDLLDGRISSSSTFDYEKTSRWWIVAHTWHAKHGIAMLNRRFYFDPVSNRLEPVSFDNDADPLGEYPGITTDPSLWSMLSEPKFQQSIRDAILKNSELLNSPEFRSRFSSEQDKYLRILQLDNMTPARVTVDQLEKNLAAISQELTLRKNEYGKRVFEPDGIDEYRLKFLKVFDELDLLHTHIRPFLFLEGDDAYLEIKNLTLRDITIHSVSFSQQPERNLVPVGIYIPAYELGGKKHIFSSLIDVAGFDLNDQMKVVYTSQDQEYTKPVILQFRNHDSRFPSQEETVGWFKRNRILREPETKTITFPAGNYVVETNLEFPNGWLVKFLPGAVIEFKKGATLKVNGPIQSLGHVEQPVKLVINTDPERGQLGSWGGLLILKANQESLMQHTVVLGSPGPRLATQQDSHGLTGCITFYKSDVQIKDSVFSGLQCEDALNIMNSKFSIDGLEIVNPSADAFDSDFSNGIITNSVFRTIENDGIDISGSRVEIHSSQFFDIGDKAVSVGEGSTLGASQLTIVSADAGVVSKDKSVVNIRNSDFENVGNALMAYVKKEEWGPAEIHCANCLFDNVESVAVEQLASRITIDGEEISPTLFSRKQLQIAGYLQ